MKPFVAYFTSSLVKRFVICHLCMLLLFSAQIINDANANSHSIDSAELLNGASLCNRYFPQYEEKYNIPDDLLHAISLTESGIWHHDLGKKVTWPWTLNVRGKGYRYQTKKETIEAVQSFMKRGIKSIDVGCMQINLYYHPDAFHSIHQALEPKYNIQYAAKLLGLHYNNTRNWLKAAGRYHSFSPHHNKRYRGEILTTWRQVNRENKYFRVHQRNEAFSNSFMQASLLDKFTSKLID